MRIEIGDNSKEFAIEFDSPTDEDFKDINLPGDEDKVSEYGIYCDRKLQRLKDLLRDGYCFVITDT